MYLGRDEDAYWGDGVQKPAYFSRFALKFAEILGAGIATAVSGYLVAHLGGFLSWPSQPSTPTAAIEVPANATAKTTERPRNRATASVPAETDTRAASARDEHSKEAARPAAKPAEVSAPAATAATGAWTTMRNVRGRHLLRESR